MLPHQACHLRQLEHGPRSILTASTKTRNFSMPIKLGENPVAVNSRRNVSQPQTFIEDRNVLRDGNTGSSPRLHDVGFSSGTSEFILLRTPTMDTPCGSDSLPPLSSHIENCSGSVDSFIGQLPDLQSSPSPAPGGRRTRPVRDGAKVKRISHWKIQSLPQASFSSEPSYIRPKQHLSVGTQVCQGGNFNPLVVSPISQDRIQASEHLPSIHAPANTNTNLSSSTSTPPEAGRRVIPLCLFPPSPTNSLTSYKSESAEKASPTTSVFDPSLSLRPQISIFEDEEEKIGLVNYLSWSIHDGKKSQKRGKRGCNWARLFCLGG